MKKLIVLSVVFALVASAAFAVDLGASVFGLVTPVQWDNDSGDITSSGSMQRLRLQGSGDVADGAFGGWIRFDPAGFDWANNFGSGVSGYAYWKPIDQFKMVIGGNPDGMYGKEGVTGWMFHENPYDAGVAFVGGNVWGWGPYNGGDIKTRDVFYGGFGGNALHLNITPIEVFTVNLVLPFFDGGEIGDVLTSVKAQLDFNLEFGNIALTYDGGTSGGRVFLYYGGPIGPLGLDVGVSYGFDDDSNYTIGAGLGLKFATDAFGIKFRVVTTITADDFNLLGEILPFFPFSDKLAVFIGIGAAMIQKGSNDAAIDFHVNPYIRVGEEWGAQFLAGVQLYSTGNLDKINLSVPIAIMLNF